MTGPSQSPPDTVTRDPATTRDGDADSDSRPWSTVNGTSPLAGYSSGGPQYGWANAVARPGAASGGTRNDPR